MAAQSLTILFRPGMEPDDRWAIEDELKEALGDQGQCTGGGTMLDLSESDIGLDVKDFQRALPVIRAILRRLEVPASTVIVEHQAEGIKHSVYE